MILNAKKKLPQTGLQKILIRGTNWIGDAIMTLPAVSSVRAAYPGAHLAILAKRPVTEIYRLFSAANEIIPYDAKFDTPLGVFRLANALRKRKFNAAVLLQNAIEAAIVSTAAGIRIRAGYNADGRGFLLTHPVRRTEEIFKVHQIDYYLEMVKSLGCAPVDRAMHLETLISPAAAQEVADKYLPDEDRGFIGLAPGAAYGPAKRWLPERFAAVADRLGADLNAQAILFGSRADRETTDEVQKHANRAMVNLAGSSSLRETIYLISRCRVFVSNDSGLMHVAAAAGTRVHALYGSSSPAYTPPLTDRAEIHYLALDCSPCFQRTCPLGHTRCLVELSPERLLAAVLAAERRLPVEEA